jgi:broad specificity phosphatase PhoE
MILVRHDETTGESSIRLNGATDVPLSDLGRKQMRAVGERLRDAVITRVVTSPLIRARESADLARGDREVPTSIVEDFREVDFGLWETLTVAEAEARDPEVMAAWRSGDPAFAYPGGETRAGFFQRIERATREVLVPIERPEETLVVVHKGVLKIVLATLLGEPFDAWRERPMSLGGIHRLGRSVTGWRLLVADEIDHLGPLHNSG